MTAQVCVNFENNKQGFKLNAMKNKNKKTGTIYLPFEIKHKKMLNIFTHSMENMVFVFYQN